jgi:hypothetical protein
LTLTNQTTETLAADHAVRRYNDIRDLIASPENPTPLVRLNHVAFNRGVALSKLEWFISVRSRIEPLYLLKGCRNEAN